MSNTSEHNQAGPEQDNDSDKSLAPAPALPGDGATNGVHKTNADRQEARSIEDEMPPSVDDHDDDDEGEDLLSTLKMPVFRLPGVQGGSGNADGAERSLPLSGILRGRRKGTGPQQVVKDLSPLKTLLPLAVSRPPVGMEKRWLQGLPDGEAKRLGEEAAAKPKKDKAKTEPMMNAVALPKNAPPPPKAATGPQPIQSAPPAAKTTAPQPKVQAPPPPKAATGPQPVAKAAPSAPQQTAAAAPPATPSEPEPTPSQAIPALPPPARARQASDTSPPPKQPAADAPAPPAAAAATPATPGRRHGAQSQRHTQHGAPAKQGGGGGGDDEMSGIVQELLDEDVAEPPVQAPKEPTHPTPPPERSWYNQIFTEDYFRTLPMGFHKQTIRETQFILNSLSVGHGGRILDLCCGFGRHTIEMAKRGYDMVGLDLSLPLLQKGLNEAQRRKLSIKFIHGDIRELNFNGVFDAAFCVHTSFGYFDDKTNLSVLQGVFNGLKAGGRFMVEVLNRDYIIQQLPRRKWWEGSDCLFLEEVSFNYETSVLHNKRTFIFDDNRPPWEQHIYIRLFSLHEIQGMMRMAGYNLLQVSGSIASRGAFFGTESPHIILLGEKPRK